MTRKLLITVMYTLLVLAAAITNSAQSTTFNYQGNLKSGGFDANGSHDFEFALFDAMSGGTQLGSTITQTVVTVTDGVFAVSLDFGNQFPGAARFVEIRVRQTGGGTFTTLVPRQSISSTPYAVKSLNSATADAVSVGGVPGGSGNYVQNATTQQPSSNFNISGTGTANVFSAASQYNIGTNRVLSVAGAQNVFVGVGAGGPNTTGSNNAFFGRDSGFANTTGFQNSFFGTFSGSANTTGSQNSFFGRDSGNANTTGFNNSFFGRSSGSANTSGEANAFVGNNTGDGNTGGDLNAFFGGFAARTNTTGSNNTIIGANADVTVNDLTFATAIGSGAVVSTSNTVVIGRAVDTVAFPGKLVATSTGVGIFNTAPTTVLDITDNGGTIIFGGAGCPAGSVAIGMNGPFSNCANYSVRGTGTDLMFNRPTSGEVLFRENNGTTQLRLRSGGVLQLVTLGTAGATALCRNASSDISTCSSSARYKDNINSFTSGLDLIRKLRPVSFNWKDGGMADMGLVAEEVAEAEPLLSTTNVRGEVEGVKYDRIGVVLINVVKEQQAQIEAQQKQIVHQQKQIDLQNSINKTLALELAALRTLVCLGNQEAAACRVNR